MGIRELREAAGMSQIYLAGQVGVHQSCVCDWERGKKKPTVDNLLKLADIFGVTTDEVLGRSRPGA